MSKGSIVSIRSFAFVFVSLVLIGGGAVGYFYFFSKPALTAVNTTSDNIAIHGYDTVAYFTMGKATKGDEKIEHIWHGARWRFSSATHRDLFKANPDRYAPRYGGYCSMGLAIGQYSDADPTQWSIVDGKLYLNKNKTVQEMWRKSPKAYIAGSEINWQKYRNKMHVNENLRWKL